MLRKAKLLAAGVRPFVIFAIMAAVVSTLSLHHGAMAAPPTVIEAVTHHDCGKDCGLAMQPMPACCGVGLCLSGLPSAFQQSLAAPLQSAKGYQMSGMAPCWPLNRIERPPKIS